VESMQQLEKEEGSGCILAHCMGLGKTLSVGKFKCQNWYRPVFHYFVYLLLLIHMHVNALFTSILDYMWIYLCMILVRL